MPHSSSKRSLCVRKGSPIDFAQVHKLSLTLAERIRTKKDELISVLTKYETHKTAEDEIERSLDLLTNLEENRQYFEKVIGPVAVFMPSNQPLYSFACFAVVPGLMSERVCVKAPETMAEFYEEMLDVLDIKALLSTIEYMKIPRKECVDMFTATTTDSATNRQHPIFEAVIFTGTTENGDKLRKSFHKSTLFIANGSGHNPVIITETADLDKAIEGALSVRAYNQGQDCAAPNSILVHASVYTQVMGRLRKSISTLHIGAYESPETDIGPISRPETLVTVEEFLTKNIQYIDAATDGVMRTRTSVIEPTIVSKPLTAGANFEELFAPIFIVQRYEADNELVLYFEDEKYAKNAMYITVYGKSEYVERFVAGVGRKLHDTSTILYDIDLHKPGAERGVQPYGGYGRGASCVSKDGVVVSKPTLPQRELYEYLVKGTVLVANNTSSRKKHSNNLQHTSLAQKNREYWGESLAKRVIEQFPSLNEYVCAAGISPSGTVHFGNFRDLFTSYVVAESIRQQGKKARLVLYWDDFDRFSKVPKNVDPSFKNYVGLPYSKVPCPDGIYASYAEKFEKEFEKSIKELGIEVEFVYQSAEYEAGVYDNLVIKTLQKRHAIADILLSFMSPQAKLKKSINDSQYRKEFYPVVLYSRFTGKDNTRILAYDGKSTLTYKCFDTGNIESVDITKERIVKLSWKVDWAMRWSKHHITFEPAGADHASPGGSFDVSSVISRDVFSATPPILQEYKFVGLQGTDGKMSSFHESTVSVGDLLKAYTPDVLKWLYAHKTPKQSFDISFGKDIFRQYDEFDVAVEKFYAQNIDTHMAHALGMAGVTLTDKKPTPVSFRQLLGFGQIVQWDIPKLEQTLGAHGLKISKGSLETRLSRVRYWLERYNSAEALTILEKVNTTHLDRMSNEETAQIKKLHDYLDTTIGVTPEVIEQKLYDIPRESDLDEKGLRNKQKRFFMNVYNLLTGTSTGPRLSTFLWALEKERVLKLLDTKERI